MAESRVFRRAKMFIALTKIFYLRKLKLGARLRTMEHPSRKLIAMHIIPDKPGRRQERPAMTPFFELTELPYRIEPRG